MEKKDEVLWTRKHMPEKSADLLGQDNAIRELRDFVLNFKKKEKKAALIFGPSGIGKTSAAYAIARELNYEILELNASDFRNRDKIDAIVGNAIRQGSLFLKSKIILVDELDGIAGREDFGGLQSLAKIIEDSPYPIILTANFSTNPAVSFWNSKFNSIKGKSILIQFNPINSDAAYKAIKRISEKEKIKIDDEVLKTISRRCGGDLRAAITDLQALTHGKAEIQKEDLESLGERKQTETMLTALLKVFKTTDIKIALGAFDNVDEDTAKQFLWIDENLPKEYTNPKDLANAYEMLSRADVHMGRIRRRQHWRLQSYVHQLLTAGVAVSKKEKNKTVVPYKQTTRLLKLWQAGMKYQRRKAISQKLSRKLHSSSKTILQDTVPYLQMIFRRSKSMGRAISEQYELTREEVEWLKGS